MKTLELADHCLGPGQPVFIVAEAGVNHNGDLNAALELVRQAKRCGADCVKFQTFQAKRLLAPDAPKAAYQLQTTDPAESQMAMLKKLELEDSAYREIMGLCNDLDILFLSTPYNFEDVEFLNDLGVAAFKVASGQAVELPFLEYVARLQKPMIVSTGMCNETDVAEALEAVRSVGNDQIVLLQCTTNYPSRLEDANILATSALGKNFDVLTGYSDHTEAPHAAYAAVALGAVMIEKHFTLDRGLDGPDHSSSFDPAQFKNFVEGIRNVEKALGSAEKRPTALEAKNIAGMRRSIVAIENIPAGATIQMESLGFKRPANGLSPNCLNDILGKRVKISIAPETPLQKEHIEW